MVVDKVAGLGSGPMRQWAYLAALVAMCASGCAAHADAVPAQSPAVTSTSTGVPGGGSYVGTHWTATQLSIDGVTTPIQAALAVTVDFLPSGSAIFSDGLNAVDARWVSLPSGTVRLVDVRFSAAGYVGHDSAQLAAMAAVRRISSPSLAGGSGAQAAAEITVSHAGEILSLAGKGVSISYRSTGPTEPELTRSAPATTSTSVIQPSGTLLSTAKPGVTIPYDLLTHCGVREAVIGNEYYRAWPVLDDGNGNPPAGWGNPYDSGTMTINQDQTADFNDAAGHQAHFVLRPGATTWLQGCA